MTHQSASPAPVATGNGAQKSDRLGSLIDPEHKPTQPATQGNGFYVPIDIKPKRHRRTKAAVGSVRDTIRAVLEQSSPQTVRQVFYALTVQERADAERAQVVSAFCGACCELR